MPDLSGRTPSPDEERVFDELVASGQEQSGRVPPPNTTWIKTECVCCQRPEHLSLLRRLMRWIKTPPARSTS